MNGAYRGVAHFSVFWYYGLHKGKRLFLFTPLEAERRAACCGDEYSLILANIGFNAPRELLTGFTHFVYLSGETRKKEISWRQLIS